MKRQLAGWLLLWAIRLDTKWAFKLMVGMLPLIEGAKAQLEAELRSPQVPDCTRAHSGWWCSRGEGHKGPCAAWPVPT